MITRERERRRFDDLVGGRERTLNAKICYPYSCREPPHSKTCPIDFNAASHDHKALLSVSMGIRNCFARDRLDHMGRAIHLTQGRRV